MRNVTCMMDVFWYMWTFSIAMLGTSDKSNLRVQWKSSNDIFQKSSPGDGNRDWPAQGVYHGRVIANHVKLHFSFISWDHLIFGSKSTVVQFDFGKRCSQKKCHLDFQLLSRLFDIKTLAVLSPTVRSVGHLKKLKCLQMQINFEIPQTLSRRFSSWTA